MAGLAGARALPTGRLGRLLALGIAALLLVVLWEAIGGPLAGLYRGRAQALAERRTVAVHMAGLAAQLPALRRAATAGGARPGPVALIAGSSDAIAAAALQEQVQQMATGLGATLSSSESLQPSQGGGQGGGQGGRQGAGRETGGYRRVGVRIAVTAPYDVMVRLLAAIEQASPSMLIDDLQLHGSRIQLLQNAPLEGSLTVLAFRRGTGTAGGGVPSDGDAEGGVEP